MKTQKKFLRLFLINLFVIPAFILFAQPNDPPSNPGNASDGPVGGVPIGGGLFILLGLGAAYGGKKLYDMRKENLEE